MYFPQYIHGQIIQHFISFYESVFWELGLHGTEMENEQLCGDILMNDFTEGNYMLTPLEHPLDKASYILDIGHAPDPSKWLNVNKQIFMSMLDVLVIFCVSPMSHHFLQFLSL